MVDATPNAALARLRAGKVALGLSVGLLPAPAMPQLARTAGYDWLAIDMEHSPLGLPEVGRLSLAALPLAVTPVVRVRMEGLHDGVRALDAGAQGLPVSSAAPEGTVYQIAETMPIFNGNLQPGNSNILAVIAFF